MLTHKSFALHQHNCPIQIIAPALHACLMSPATAAVVVLHRVACGWDLTAVLTRHFPFINTNTKPVVSAGLVSDFPFYPCCNLHSVRLPVAGT